MLHCAAEKLRNLAPELVVFLFVLQMVLDLDDCILCIFYSCLTHNTSMT